MIANRTPFVILFVGLLLLSLTVGAGCAHRRESYYARTPGVHVRAPFVDVRVPTGPRGVRVESRLAPEPSLDSDSRTAYGYDDED